MKKRRISRKSRKQVLSMLEYLNKIGITCNVTLYYLDEDLEFTRERGVHINLNKIPMDIIKGKRDYGVRVKLDGFLPHYFQSHHPFSNEYGRRGLEKSISVIYSEEEIINYNRKKVLDDILNDPNPLPLK